MVEAARIVKWLRAVVPALKPNARGAAQAEPQAESENRPQTGAEAADDGRAPVYVPARRGAQPRRRGAANDGDPR